MRGPYVVVSGSIATGKSTLVARLAGRCGWQPFFEQFVDNPFVAKTYADPARWALANQTYFMATRLQEGGRIAATPDGVVHDQSVWGDAVYADYFRETGAFDADAWACYRALYDGAVAMLPRPDIVVYLQAGPASQLVRIHEQRGRAMERGITPGYLATLNRCFDRRFLGDDLGVPVVFVDTETTDVRDDAALDRVVSRVRAAMTGASAGRRPASVPERESVVAAR